LAAFVELAGAEAGLAGGDPAVGEAGVGDAAAEVEDEETVAASGFERKDLMVLRPA